MFTSCDIDQPTKFRCFVIYLTGGSTAQKQWLESQIAKHYPSLVSAQTVPRRVPLFSTRFDPNDPSQPLPACMLTVAPYVTGPCNVDTGTPQLQANHELYAIALFELGRVLNPANGRSFGIGLEFFVKQVCMSADQMGRNSKNFLRFSGLVPRLTDGISLIRGIRSVASKFQVSPAPQCGAPLNSGAILITTATESNNSAMETAIASAKLQLVRRIGFGWDMGRVPTVFVPNFRTD